MALVSPADDYKVGVPDDKTAVEGFLQLLARAVRQFHTYPQGSPLCTDAVAAAAAAFAALERSDWLILHVTPHALLFDHQALGTGTIVEHELVRRLHRGRVAALHLDRSAAGRDFTHFCADLLRATDLAATQTTLLELLTDHGVETIVAQMAQRPEVLAVGRRPESVWNLVAHETERRARAEAAGPTSYLYPPQKGWVRLEPGAAAETISLVDLAVLVDDPADVASMLLRLTDEEPTATARDAALERKFSDVAMLFNAMDGHLARLMFAKLARAVLAIPEERRTNLLKRTILPALLDGRPDGAVMRDFPDPDLAESLCLLLDMETAAPEVVSAAMHRLDLPTERKLSVAALVEQRLEQGIGHDGADRAPQADRYARRLIRVEAAGPKSFAEFAGFDLAIDDHAAAAILDVRDSITSADRVGAQLACVAHLVALEPNPTLTAAFMRRAIALFADLQRAGRWDELAGAVERYRAAAEQLRESRPDVTATIDAAFEAFCTPPRVLSFLDLAAADPSALDRVAAALGGSLVAGALALLDDARQHDRANQLTQLLCNHAAAMAPALAARLDSCRPSAVRTIVRVLGHAGSGYEPAVASRLADGDPQVVREAMRALARIGSGKAASIVAAQVQEGTPAAQAAAEEALWRFSPSYTAMQLRELLGNKDFVVHHPQLVGRLIDRAAQVGAGGLDQVLGEIEGLRYRFWNPGLVRVAMKAREMRAR